MSTRGSVICLGLLLAIFSGLADARRGDAAGDKGVSDVDVWVTLSNGLEVIPGGATTVYTVQVGNHGPGNSDSTMVSVIFDAEFAVDSWTCAPSGIASCPASGSGNIVESVSVPVGDRVQFTINASISATPEGLQVVDASATGQPGTSDLDNSNNTASLSQTVGIFGSTFEDLPPERLFDPTDLDLDGWTPATGDCCEDAGSCPNPTIVNPGAAEILGNGVDDDCNIATLDDAAESCSATQKFGNVSSADLRAAMELCQLTMLGQPISSRRWGVISAEFLNADGTQPSVAALNTMQDIQTAVLGSFGTGGIVAQAGPTFAGLSNGAMRDAGDPGYVAPNGGSDFGRSGNPPNSYLAANGGALPSSASCYGNCPAGSGANDSVNLRLQIRVPTNALGFSYDFQFWSSEYWDWSCTTFNDFALALLTTGAGGIPADGNISFDALNNPISVNNSFFEVCQVRGCSTCPSGTGPLAGTGFDALDSDSTFGTGMTGGATGWLRTTAPVVPGEVMQLDLMIFDVSDGILNSLLLLDNFQWLYDPTGVGTGPPG